MQQLTQAEIEERLLTYIRKSLSGQEIEYSQPPVLYREGRRLRTYLFRLKNAPKEYARPLVMRLYTEDELPVSPQFESILLNSIYEQKFPVPNVRLVERSHSYLNAPFIIMDECLGDALFDINSLTQKPYMQAARFLVSGVGSIARDMAAVMKRLHILKVDKLHEKLKQLKFPVELLSLNGRLYQLYKRVQSAKLTELEPGVIWLISHGPPETIKPSLCHGQLYPNNVRKQENTFTGVINWSMDSILLGDPAYDVGRTSAAFKCFVPDVSQTLRKLSQNVGHRFSRQFVQNYRKQRPVSEDKIKYFEMLWCIDLATSAAESMDKKHHAFKNEFEEAKVDLYQSTNFAIEYFKNTTGVTVSLPLLKR